VSTPPQPPAERTSFQSILLPVPEVNALVAPFRRAGDWSSAHGVPAHMTIAGPWPLSVPLPLERLAELAGRLDGTRFALGEAGRLGDAICLFPDDDRPLLRWRTRILETVGIEDAADEKWRLHLTVCRGPHADTFGAVEEAMAAALPIRCRAQGLLLAEMHSASDVSVRLLPRKVDERIRLVPYDPSWPQRFAAERVALIGAIGQWATGGIHHVGSTAVPGLEAKPIIDVLVGVDGLEASRACFDSLARLGYLYAPYRSEEMHWFCKPHPSRRTHHLHLVPTDSSRFRDELAFRDRLRGNPEIAEEYAALKRALAERFATDREAYTDAKADFIRRILDRS
jgi:GrpB-like predicted nucleotidyltransferase (UPF0157 family)